MKIIVDTCIWSLALRRQGNQKSPLVNDLINFINEFRVQMIGPIRQEILSGIATEQEFTKLKKYLTDFPDLFLNSSDYEQAASYFNLCRKNGIQGSHIDFLICSVAIKHKMQIFTTDKDFLSYKKILPISLIEPTYIN